MQEIHGVAKTANVIFARKKSGAINMAPTSRMSKEGKDVFKHVNAQSIGTNGVYPHAGRDFEPSIKILQQVVLERNDQIKCSNWKRDKLIEWLQLNKPLVLPHEVIEILPASPSVPISVTSPVKESTLTSLTSGPSNKVFRWHKNLEARLVCVLCSDPEKYCRRDELLSRQQIDAGQRINPFWIYAAEKFNDAALVFSNEFSYIVQLKDLSPSIAPTVPIDAGDIKKKFTELRSRLTKAIVNFSASGAGTGKKPAAFDREDNLEVLIPSEYDWGPDAGVCDIGYSTWTSNYPVLLTRIKNCLSYLKINNIEDATIKEKLELVAFPVDEEEGNSIETINLRDVLNLIWKSEVELDDAEPEGTFRSPDDAAAAVFYNFVNGSTAVFFAKLMFDRLALFFLLHSKPS